MPRSQRPSSKRSANSTKNTAGDIVASPNTSDSAGLLSARSADTSVAPASPPTGNALVKRKIGRPPEVVVYGLIDANGVIRYIGKAKSAKKRFHQHIRDAKANRGINVGKETWIRAMIEAGQLPGLIELCVCDETNWRGHERRLINQHRVSLTNISCGGNQPTANSEVNRNNYRSMISHRDWPISRAKRTMTAYAKSAMKQGNVESATKLIGAIIAMEQSSGLNRDRLNAWAKERFCYETTEETTSRTTA